MIVEDKVAATTIKIPENSLKKIYNDSQNKHGVFNNYAQNKLQFVPSKHKKSRNYYKKNIRLM